MFFSRGLDNLTCCRFCWRLQVQYIDGLIAIVVFGIVSWGVSKITMKSIILRRLIIGTPTIVIQKGKILEKSLKKLNIDINDLLEQCRSNGNFDISQIEENDYVYILDKSNENESLEKFDFYNLYYYDASKNIVYYVHNNI